MLACLALVGLIPAGFVKCDSVFADGFVGWRTSDGKLMLVDSGSPDSITSDGTMRVLKSDQKPIEIATRSVGDAWQKSVATMRIDGVIGCDLLARAQLIIDYGRKELFFKPLAKDDKPGSELGFGRSVDVICERDLYFVDASIGNSTARLLVDTGANVLALSPGILSKISKTLTQGETLSGFDGSPSVNVYRIPKVTIGPLLIPSLRVFEEPDIADDGTIGGWMFSRERVLLDFPRSKIWVPAARK